MFSNLYFLDGRHNVPTSFYNNNEHGCHRPSYTFVFQVPTTPLAPKGVRVAQHGLGSVTTLLALKGLRDALNGLGPAVTPLALKGHTA